jgi:hypothetical protein
VQPGAIGFSWYVCVVNRPAGLAAIGVLLLIAGVPSAALGGA